MKTTLFLSLLLTGCAATSAPKPLAKLPPLPPGFAARSFQPASLIPTEPILGIYPFGASHYLIVAHQAANSVLEMQWADTISGPWNFLAGYGWTAEERYVSAAILSDWLPYHRMFVTATNSFSPLTPAWAKIKGPAEIYTNHKLTIKGQIYRLIEISPPGAQFKTYKLLNAGLWKNS